MSEEKVEKYSKRAPNKAILSEVKTYLEKQEGYTLIPKAYIQCARCGKPKSTLNRNYYKSNADIYKGYGYVPICTSCLEKKYLALMKDNDMDEKLAMYYLMMEINVPWSERVWQAVKDINAKIGRYLGIINGATHYRDITFYESDEFIYETENIDIEEAIESMEKGDTILTKKMKDELVERFGNHYTNEQLMFLNNKYRDWITRHVCEELSQEILFAEISIKQLELREARKKGSPTKEILDAMDKLMKANNVQPQTMKNGTKADGLNRLSLVIKDFEEYRPAEYFQDKKLFDDFDNIKELMKNEVLRPMKNYLTGTRDFDPRYNINDEGE